MGLVNNMYSAEQNIKILAEQIATLTAEKRKYQKIYDDAKAELLADMEANGVMEEERDGFLLSRRASQPRVVLECDPEELPNTCCRIKLEADKTAIKKRLLAGEEIEGAFLEDVWALIYHVAT